MTETAPLSQDEPTLEEAVDDPIVKLLMHYDGVTPETIYQLSEHTNKAFRKAA